MNMPGVIGIKIVGDASGLTATMQDAGRNVERFGGQAKGSADSVAALGSGLKSAFVGSSLAVAIIALKNNIAQFTDAMVDAQIQADKLRNGLNFAVGKTKAGTELQFIKDQVKSLGLDFGTASQQYTKLAAAARGTSLEGDKIRKVFESVAQASTVMGLSAQSTERVMNALTQILSKGRVQTEEIVGQVGESLPGAFALASQAMGVTTKEMTKMLETGQVLSTDFLPRFADVLSKKVAPELNEASRGMQQSINRLNSAWLEFKQTVAGSGVADTIGNEATGIGNYLATLTEAMERAKASGRSFAGQLDALVATIIYRIPFDVASGGVNTLNRAFNFLTGNVLKLRTDFTFLPQVFETNAQKAALLGGRLAAAESDLAALQARLKLNPENIYLKSQAYQAFLLAEELRAAKKAQDDLAGGDATRQGIVANGVGRLAVMERLAQEKKDREAARAKFNEKYASPQESFRAELAKEKEAMGELFTPAMEQRIRERFIKPIKAAKESLDEWSKAVAGKYVSAMGDFAKLQDNAIKSTLGLTAAEEKLREVLKSPEFSAMNRRQQENIIMQAAEAQAAEATAKATNDLNKERLEALNKLKGSAEEQVKSLQRYQDESQAVSIAAAQNISLASAVELVAIARLQEARAIQLSYGEQSAADEIQKEIDARRKLATLINDKDIRKKTEDENKKIGEDLERIITDGLFKGFENGKGFAENFADTLEATFKTMVLRPVIKATVDGALGLDGGGGGLSGGIGGFVGGLEKAGKVFEGVSLALTDFKTFAGNQAYELGGALTKAGFKDAGNFVTGNATSIGNAVNIVGKGLSYLEALSNLKDGSWGKAIGQGIGTYIAGPIGGQIGKAIGNIADRIFGSDQGPTAAGVNSSFDAQGNLIGRVKSAATSNAEVDQFTSLLGASYQQILTKFGATGKANTFGFQKTTDGFFDVSANVGGGGVFQQGRTQYTPEALQLASSRAIFAALQASELPGYLSKAFNGIVANTASAEQINGALQFAESLKSIRFGLLSATEQAAEYQKIVDASTVSLGTSAATFKQDFIKAIDEGLTPEGLAQWSALGGTLQALEEITGKAADGVDDVTRSLKDIANERKSLQDQLDELTLSGAQLLEKQRNALDESNRGLFDLVQTAKALKAATDASVGSQQSLIGKYTAPITAAGAATALGPTVVASIQGKSGDEIRAMALTYAKSLDTQTEAGRAAIAQLETLTGAIDFFATAADNTAEKTRNAAETLQATNRGLQDQLDLLTGKKTQLDLDLRDATDESTRSLIRQIDATKTYKTVLEENTKLQQSYASITKSLATAKLDATLSGLSDFSRYFAKADGASGLIGALDGSLETLQELGSASVDMYREQLGLVQQIRTAAESVSATFSDSIRTIKLDMLQTPEKKYDFFDKEAQKYRDILSTLTDPQAISLYAGKLNNSIMAGYGTLDDTQKQSTGNDFITLLDNADALIQTRFGDAQAQVTSNYTLLAQKIEAAIAKGIEEGLKKSAADLGKAADKMQTAADTPVDVNVRITTDVAATSELVTV